MFRAMHHTKKHMPNNRAVVFIDASNDRVTGRYDSSPAVRIAVIASFHGFPSIFHFYFIIRLWMG